MDIEQKRKPQPFVNLAEVEFARLLSFYGIEWQYEPFSFPLRWQDGRVVEMFTPDFYLPEYDLYIELTTMKQKLVTRKNRKVRLLHQVYPDVNIKLLYRRDFQRLFGLFGTRFIEEAHESEQRFAPTESGTPFAPTGQVWGGGEQRFAPTESGTPFASAIEEAAA